MKIQKSQTSSFLHIIGAIAVFAFTASCTVDLFRKITPASTPWLPWLSVAILEYGLFNWGYAYLHKYDKQHHPKKNLIALAMATFSGLCIATVTTIELANVVQVKGMASVPTELLSYAVWVPVVAVGLNVMAYLGCVVFTYETPAPAMQAMVQGNTQPYYVIQSEQQQGGYIQAPFTMLPLPQQAQQYQQATNQQAQTLQSQGEQQASGNQESQKSKES